MFARMPCQKTNQFKSIRDFTHHCNLIILSQPDFMFDGQSVPSRQCEVQLLNPSSALLFDHPN